MRCVDRRILMGLTALLGCGCGPRLEAEGAAGARATADTLSWANPSFDLDATRAAIASAANTFQVSVRERQGRPALQEQLAVIYGEAMAPVWVNPAGRPTPTAVQALQALRAADEDGLRPADYGVARLDALVTQLDSASHTGPDDIAAFELGLSTALLQFAADLQVGRVTPSAVGFRLRPAGNVGSIPSLVASAIASGRVAPMLEGLRPQVPQYRALRAALARYRAMADSAPESVPLPQQKVRPGETWHGAPAVRRLLLRVGDLTAGPVQDSLRYDPSLAGAVAHFQARHGLAADSVLGQGTVKAMQVPFSTRREQLELALERFRWLARPEGRLILVNIPTFQLWAWDTVTPTSAPSLSMAVVVGRAYGAKTPVMHEDLSYLVFRPYWNVPRSIAVNEILPALRRDSTYLVRHQMELVGGLGDNSATLEANADNIDRFHRGELRVRQRPGTINALGRVKFIFPNNDAIYLHDSPAKSLFSRARRDFSHGCVRVERPDELAEWVLAEREGWNGDKVKAAMASSAMQTVTLTQTVPVVLFYSTAIAEPDGAVRFAEDIYGHDVVLRRALLTS